MPYNIDYTTASSAQIEAALCRQLERIRLSRNITQVQLAEEAGISSRTIRRLEKGQGTSLDTFIRVLTALGLQRGLAAALPDPSIRPVERIETAGRERKRARPRKPRQGTESWVWGDERNTNG